MSRKASRRERYVRKWNGPDSWVRRKLCRRMAKAGMGKGPESHRVVSTAYECRYRGFFPQTAEELHRRAGIS